MELAIVLIIALVVFGPKKLPELGKGLGNGMREFKSSITGEDDHKGEDAHRARLEAVSAESREESPVKAA
jgi:sec-independent protein translocase protein TatA